MKILASEVSERVSRAELQQSVTQQVKPLVVAMAALEKVVHIQETSHSRERQQQQQLHEAEIAQQQQLLQQQQQQYRKSSSPSGDIDKRHLQSLVSEILHEQSHLHSSTGSGGDMKLQQELGKYTDDILKEMRNMNDVC